MYLSIFVFSLMFLVHLMLSCNCFFLHLSCFSNSPLGNSRWKLHSICKHLLEVVTFLKIIASNRGYICSALIKWDFMVSKYLILCSWNISLI